jgi:hypothetical protein
LTTFVVIKILVVGALLGGFVMFSIFRRKQHNADGKPVGLIATLVGFTVRVFMIGVVAFSAFWFVTKFMA